MLKQEKPHRILNEEISLARLELLEVEVPQIAPFRSAIGVRHERQALFLRWTDAEGRWGIGECSCRPDPFFNCEFVSGAMTVIRDFIFPHLPANGNISAIAETVSKTRGWHFTASAILDAVMDLRRRSNLPDALADWPHERLDDVPVGISLGIFDTPSAAVDSVTNAMTRGYHRVKLKIKPGMDINTIAAIRESFPDIYLGFDANGACRESDFDFLKSLAAFRPAMLEQPFAPGRLDLHRELKRLVPALKICLDESITGVGDLVAAHQLQALDEVNIKPGRVGGIFETLKMMEYCRSANLPAWVGGMFETGVGRLANLRVAARLPNAKAHDLSPSNRYFKLDVVQQPITMTVGGTIHLADDRPVELDEENLNKCLKNKITLVKETA